MHIEQLTLEQFQEFAQKHPLRNYCQTINYALAMGEYDYDYELLGLVENERIYAASLILTKRVGFKLYFAYAPKGFLIDYTDQELFSKFITLLKDHYAKKGYAFIKINPEIAIGEVDLKEFNTIYNNNYQIIKTLTNNGFQNVSVNQDFDETLFPTFTGIISLKSFGISNISKNTRNKIRKGIRMGLSSEFGSAEELKIIKKFLPEKTDYYYEDLYNAYQKNNLVDIILVYVDPEKYLINAQKDYEQEAKNNYLLAESIMHNHSKRNINKKMNSDRTLLTYKNSIVEASKLMNEKKKIIVAGAIIVKEDTRIRIIASGYNKAYKHFVPNYYLYYSILNNYKDNYLYADLNGLSNKFNKEGKYSGLNRFKLGFKPKVYELIGEYDLVLSQNGYKLLFEDTLISKIYKKLQ